MSVSVIILTYNEQDSLPRCLASVAWSDDVVVFDSFSSDRTIEIAREHGARVIQRHFDDYGSQREAARSEVDYKHPWVLAVDADEEPDEHLMAEVQWIARSGNETHAAYRMRRKDHFLGRWIKRSTLYPSWFIRFYCPRLIHYEARTVHEYPQVEGSIGQLQGHLLHHSFSKGLSAWLSKHNRYAELEAMESMKSLRSGKIDWWGLLAMNDPVRGRRALKDLTARMPFRPALRFFYMYLLRGGFLDGGPGLIYCQLLAIYEYMIVIKMNELKRREQGQPI